MSATSDFRDFFALYSAVMGSDLLTVAEKTALIEAAFDEYSIRMHPPAFRAVAEKLARKPHAAAKQKPKG